ncbi:MAG: ABC transporter substrate-binding protein [Hyphomicrobiales bacterium]|nr:ABC transporter substrate-binding protein [Hyphomicrobiales bacterium]
MTRNLKKFISISAGMLLAASTAFAGPPEEPRVLNFDNLEKEIGQSGGSIRMLMAKPKDVRWMTVYSGARLVAYDETFQLKPDILKEIENVDNKSFTLHLRKGHKWSDGQPFTTEDFRYWWEDVAQNEALSKGGPPRQMLANGKPPKVEIIDSHTIRYTWDSVNPLFMTALAGARPMYIYMPAHYLKQFHEKYGDADNLAALVESEQVQNWSSLHKRFGRQYRPENPDMPTLQAWMNTTKLPSERIVFKRNPNYHRVDPNGTQLPYLDEVILNMASSSIIAAKAGTGESDLQARYVRFDNYSFLKQGAEEGGYNVYLWPSGRGSEMTLLPNLNAKDEGFRKAFQDVRVRRALSMGMDRSEINEAIFFGLGREASNSVLPSSPLYKDAYGEAWIEYDVDAANALLDEAGFDKRDDSGTRLMPDGRPFEIIVETAGELSQETDILQLITDHWKDIGVKLFVKPSQRDILRGRVSNGETVMSTWQGLNRGLATPEMNPEELAPVSPVQAQWPTWGNHYASKGAAGEAPSLPEVARLSELYQNWRDAADYDAQAKIWDEMLSIFTDQVYSIGIVSGGLQPIVVSKKLRNVPEEGIWAFEPTLYFGQYLPDTFWLEK